MTEAPLDIDGPLYVEVNKMYEEMFCTITNRKFQAFRKMKTTLPSSRANRQETPYLEVGLHNLRQ
jgi:hypothetical protein